MKITGKNAASQIIAININLFPSSHLSCSFGIIKLSSGRSIEIRRIGVEVRKGKRKSEQKHSLKPQGKCHFSSNCSAVVTEYSLSLVCGVFVLYVTVRVWAG